MPTRNPRTTAQIAGHPVHPMVIPLPIAFLVATFVCDVIFWRTGAPPWSTASLYLLGAALITAALAAVVGRADLLCDAKIRALSAAWHHMMVNLAYRSVHPRLKVMMPFGQGRFRSRMNTT